jgi:hypothetical protein
MAMEEPLNNGNILIFYHTKMSRRNRKQFRGRRRTGGMLAPMGRIPITARQSMVFRLCQSFSLSSNGSGTLAAVVYNDPGSSYSNFTEHNSDLANLFNQYRFIKSRIQCISTVETKGQTTVIAIGYQNRGTSSLGTPSSVNQVLDNQPSWLWAVSNDMSPFGFTKTQRMTGILYAATNSSGSTEYSGAPGGWQFYGAALPTSTVIVFLKLECWYEYRSRS